MTDRYELPDPLCKHKRTGIVTSGDFSPDIAHAATNVCDRSDCIEDAKQWVYAKTHRSPIYKKDTKS